MSSGQLWGLLSRFADVVGTTEADDAAANRDSRNLC
jgi:hypothetical protein